MRHNEKSENIAHGRRSLVIASQAVGVNPENSENLSEGGNPKCHLVFP